MMLSNLALFSAPSRDEAALIMLCYAMQVGEQLFTVLISARALGKTAVIWAVLMMAFYPEKLGSTTKPGVYSNRNCLQLSFLSVVVLNTFHCHLLCRELEKNCRNL